MSHYITELVDKYYLNKPLASDMASTTVLVAGFEVRSTRLKGVDVFPNVSRKSYHVVVVNGREMTRAAYEFLYPLGERLVHVDGVFLPKRTWKKPGDALVWWFECVWSDHEGEESSTIVMKEGWHSRCLSCGDCCSNVARRKGQTFVEALNSPCHICHSGVREEQCPYLIVRREGTKCSMYKERPSCCRNYPARNPACTFIIPTCGLFNQAYIETSREYQRLEKANLVLVKRDGKK